MDKKSFKNLLEKTYYKNKKKGDYYKVMCQESINTTNAQDGEEMVIYTDMKGKVFQRKKSEFFEKFEQFKIEDIT